MKRLFGDAEHLVRVLGLFGAGLLVFLGLQALFVPEGFGRYGHYRAGALDDSRARPLVHAGRAACAECHDGPAAELAAGAHARIGCESCHGAQGVHAADPEKATPALPQGPALCLRCHAASVARPAAFPQVDPREHGTEGACADCHRPHRPGEMP